MADATSRTGRITIERFASAEEADRADLRYWLQLTEAERVLQAWRLSVELWTLRGEAPDERGLCRSVARVHRR
jgi:hypothetical protein